MNVAFVSNVVYPFVTGGAQKRIYEIGTRLVERGHSVTVYGRHFWDGPAEMDYDGLQLRAVADGREIYTDDRRSITEAVEFATRLYRPLRRHVDEHDVVVASVFPYFPVLTAAAVTRGSDVPLVTTWHECWQEYWWDYLGMLAPGGIAIERVVAKLPQHPIAVSSATANQLSKIGPQRSDIAVVSNGVDVEHIRSVPAIETDTEVVFVGRLIEAKRVDRLLDALAKLDRVPTTTIIGEGAHRDTLESRAHELGIKSRVEFLGELDDHDDVLGYLKAADVFATASTREGFGITLVEAMAADCTVVATDHPRSAAKEVLDGGGFLAGPTSASLATQLERALAGERPPVEPIQRAQQFDWEAVTDDALAAYRDAIANQ